MASGAQARLLYLIDIRINTAVDSVLKGLNTRLDVLEKNLKRVGQASRQATTGIATLQKQMLMLGLSTMFFGMQLYMVSRNIMRSLVTAFVNARAEGDYFVNRLLAVNAAFEFMKFAIMDAFAQSELFDKITQGIISLLNTVAQFIAKHPALSAMIITLLGIAIGVGGILFMFGSLAMGINAIITLVTTLAGWFAAVKVAGLSAAMITVGSWLLVGAAILLAIAAVTLVVRHFDSLWTLVSNGAKLTSIAIHSWLDNFSTNIRVVTLAVRYHWNSMLASMARGFESMINKVIGWLNQLIDKYNAVKPAWMGSISNIELKTGAGQGFREKQSELHDRMLDQVAGLAANDRYRDRLRAEIGESTDTALDNLKQRWDSDNDFLKSMLGFGGSAPAADIGEQSSGTVSVGEVNINVNNPQNGDEIIDDLEDYFTNAERRLLGTPNSG